MNELLRSQLKKIADQVEDLNDLLQESREQVLQQQEDHERLLKDFWNRQKELSVLKESQEDYERLQQENEQFHAARQDILDRMGRLLTWTKALSGELRQ